MLIQYLGGAAILAVDALGPMCSRPETTWFIYYTVFVACFCFDSFWNKKTMSYDVVSVEPKRRLFVEAFVSAVGMGDDINAIIRTCPAPRDGESQLACVVNGEILSVWVGNLATKLALAAANCALTLNVDAVCSAGVTGLVSAMGEIAAGASLGAATCAPTPPSLSTTKILGVEKIQCLFWCLQPSAQKWWCCFVSIFVVVHLIFESLIGSLLDEWAWQGSACSEIRLSANVVCSLERAQLATACSAVWMSVLLLRSSTNFFCCLEVNAFESRT